MNNIFKIKWNAATQSYMVCSELARRAGKATVGAGLLAATMASFTPSAEAAECNSWTINTNTTCDITATERTVEVSNGGSGLLVGGAGINQTIKVNILSDLIVNSTAVKGPYHPGGISIHGGLGSADLNAENNTLTINVTQKGGQPDDVAVKGLAVISGGTLNAKTLSVNVTAFDVKKITAPIPTGFSGWGEYLRQTALGDAGTESHGIQVGTANSGDDNRSDRTSIVKVGDSTINITNSENSDGAYQLSAIRVIRSDDGISSNALFESTGDLTINVSDSSTNKSGGYLVGVYVSGKDNKVILNNSNIKIKTEANTNEGGTLSLRDSIHSSALKIGKARSTGTGGGEIESKGHLILDTTEAKFAPTVRLVGDNSKLIADFDNSKGEIKSANSAILYGANDLAAAGYGSSQQAKFRNTQITTSEESTNALIQVNNQTKAAIFELKGNESFAVASNKGYLINMSGGSSTTSSSELTFNAEDKGYVTGLTNKNTRDSLIINLKKGFTWNLREHTNATGDLVKLTSFTTLNLEDGATLDAVKEKTDAASDFTAKGNVISESGIINLANDRFNDVLTIEGNYEGKNGAVLKVNTDWNSPGDDVDGTDSISDLLVITGNASGNTTVQAIKADGSENVIDGDIGSIAADLYKNSAVVVRVKGTDSGVEGDLVGPTYKTRSSFTGEARTTGAGLLKLTSRVNTNNETEYFWTISQTNSTNSPTYDPVVPAYVLAPQANLELGYTTLATLHERRGENQTLAWDDCGNCGEKARGQSWGRIFGKHLELNGKTRLGAKHNIYGFQLGQDFAIQRTEEGGHRLTGGYVSYGTMNSTYSDRFDDEAQTGKSKQKGWNLGLTHTRYAPNGAYVDLVGQIGFLNNNYQAHNGVEAKQKGTALALSVEVGRPYALREHKTNEGVWLIEPQAQLMYQMLKLKDFKDDIKHIKGGSHHGLRGRLGVRLAYNTQAAEDKYRTNTFYVIANLLQDFSKGKGVQIGQDKVKETFAKTWAEVGLGGQLPVGKQSYVYADARYERSLSGAKREGYRGTVGFKYTWK